MIETEESMPPQSYPRAYSAAHFALEIANQPSGFVRSVEGGGIKAEVLDHKVGGQPGAWRQLSRPKYDDIKLSVGMSMAPDFYTWIEAFFSGKGTRKSGAIVAGDFQYRERSRREFMDAIISELTFPALDATDRNACTMGITLAPERVAYVKGESQPLSRFVGSMRQKLWTPANFVLSIDGLEAA
ncbi:MAG TPA: phage tail protein, partial [Kofleriaceae bacterium]|nr:phage tail protein [Kofleriaceae bacterium]